MGDIIEINVDEELIHGEELWVNDVSIGNVISCTPVNHGFNVQVSLYDNINMEFLMGLAEQELHNEQNQKLKLRHHPLTKIFK